MCYYDSVNNWLTLTDYSHCLDLFEEIKFGAQPLQACDI